MPGQAVTLPMVEACLASRRGGLAFPPEIEALYDTRMHSYRVQAMRRTVLPTIVVYNVFLIADFLLVRETLLLATLLHLLVVTPTILLANLLYPKARRQWQRELAATAIPFLMVAQIMFIYRLNAGTAADHYQYLAVTVVIYMNMNQRLGYRLALASTLLLMATYLAVLLSGSSAFEVKFIGTSLMAAAAYLSLMANWRMEHDVRFAFLSRLADRLRREGAEEVARLDALTGLANRRCLDETAAGLWGSPGREHSPVAVVMIDIDHFKPFNDRYGHVAGDSCLKRVAGAIASELRSADDLAVRLGGEEFMMMLPGADMSAAVRVAERVRRQVEGLAIPHEALGARSTVTVSLGVTAGPVGAHSLAEFVAAADAALYAAKRSGRNQVWPPFVRKGGAVTPLRPDGAADGAADGKLPLAGGGS